MIGPMDPIRTAATALLLLLPGCASLFDVSEKSVEVNTLPSGALVNLNGVFKGTSPCTFGLPRSGGGRLEFEVLPPRESTERLWTQRRTVSWKQLPDQGAVLYFDLRLESVHPTQPYEVRNR